MVDGKGRVSCIELESYKQAVKNILQRNHCTLRREEEREVVIMRCETAIQQ